MALLDVRVAELTRRSESLRREKDQWIAATGIGQPLEKNQSQLDALDRFMTPMFDEIQGAAERLNVLADTADPTDLLAQTRVVENGLKSADNAWNIFRTPLQQRFDPIYARGLRTADLVAHDCYQTVRNRVTALGIAHRMSNRDYPLPYLLADYSPWTVERAEFLQQFLRGILNDLPNLPGPLPIPIVFVPWNHLMVPWELLSLHHEVSHDIDTDVVSQQTVPGNIPDQYRLTVELGDVVYQGLIASGCPEDRARRWQFWMIEIFADACGLLLAGPSFASFLASFLILPVNEVQTISPTEPHPVPYVRILLNGALVQEMAPNSSLTAYLDPILDHWKQLYEPGASALQNYVEDCPRVAKIMLTSPLKALQDKGNHQHTIGELAVFGPDQFAAQIAARDTFLAGKVPSADAHLALRHIIGAAYMAWEHQVEADSKPDPTFADILATNLGIAIDTIAPPGQLPARKPSSISYLEDLGRTWFAAGLKVNGDGNG